MDLPPLPDLSPLVDVAGDARAWLVALVIVLAVARAARPARRWRRTDPQRWFDYAQRVTARTRAGGRCEYASRGRRCPNRVQETDHFFPHSRGGATSLTNAVAACRAHNQDKEGVMPSTLQRWGIAWRRRTYFPKGVDRMPGQWYRRSLRRRRR